MAQDLYCKTCGSVGRPKRVTRGSFGLEVVLWLCFLIPGILYSLWRLTTKHEACRTCGADTLIPLNSPMAVAALQSQKASAGGER